MSFIFSRNKNAIRDKSRGTGGNFIAIQCSKFTKIYFIRFIL